MMLDLCNTTKYYTDAGLSDQTDRLPRPVEDIQIIGAVYSDESIDFPSLSGLCGINEIASLTINFSITSGTLIVKGNRSENPNNLRQPVEPELSRIMNDDPLRYNHGWYTIDPSFSIGCIITNGNVGIENLGFNNKRIDCSNFKSSGSIIADNTLSVNKIEFLNNSKAYNCQLICNDFFADSSVKMDNMTIQSSSGLASYSGGSYLNCKMDHPNFKVINNCQFLNCLVSNISSGLLDNCKIYKSTIVSNASGYIKTSNIAISGSNLTVDKLRLNGGTSIDSSIEANDLATAMQQHFVTNTIIKSDTVDNCSFNNSGILIFNSGGKLQLTNYAQAQIDILDFNIGSIITNASGGFLNIKQSGYLSNGANNSTIGGNIVEYGSGFLNTSNGIITASICNIRDSGRNNGIISKCNLYDTAMNNSITGYGINNATFYNRSKNNGYVNIGEFYDNSQNLSTGIFTKATFYSGSINAVNIENGIASLIFQDTSKNSGNIVSAMFYANSINSGNCSGCKFFDKALFQGSNDIYKPIPKATHNEYLNNTSVLNKIDTDNCVFKDNSNFDSIIITNRSMNERSSGTIIEMRNSSKGKSVEFQSPQSGSFFMYDTSIVDNISGIALDPGNRIHINNFAKVHYSSGDITLSFFNNSLCGNSEATVKLYDSASGTGTSYKGSLTLYDNSSIGLIVQDIKEIYTFNNSKMYALSSTIQSGIFSDNSKISGNIINTGIIIGSAKLLSLSFAESLMFKDSASNNIQINSIKTIFENNSTNTSSGTMSSSGVAFFENSKNYGVIDARKIIFDLSNNHKNVSGTGYFILGNNYGSGNIMHFGSGSTNYGTVDVAYFYEESKNLGVVRTGIFDTTVTNTGTVLNNGSITNLGKLGYVDNYPTL